MLEKIPPSIGEALESARAGMENIVLHRVLQDRELARCELSSSAFAHMGRIPRQFTADGAGLSPPLSWRKVPEATGGLMLIVEDADSPTPHPLVHAIVVLRDADQALMAGALPSPQHTRAPVDVGVGVNSFLGHGWLPPDPPPGHGPHRYAFQLFAMPSTVNLPKGLPKGSPNGSPNGLPEAPGRSELFDVVREHAIAVGLLVGIYERSHRELAADDDAEVERLVAEHSLTPA